MIDRGPAHLTQVKVFWMADGCRCYHLGYISAGNGFGHGWSHESSPAPGPMDRTVQSTAPYNLVG